MFLDVSELLKRGFPVITWCKNYNADKAIGDLVAGVTIGLTLIPQCIAYASLAELGPEYGLYSSLCGGIIYAIFGTVPELNIAPTALLSLLTLLFTQQVTFGRLNAAILLCFLSGIIEVICGGLHLGFLVDFVSTPVVAAFTSAGAITIASSQVKNLLGLKFSTSSFTGVWTNVFTQISETKMPDALLGISCCTILIVMRKLKDFGSPPLDDKKGTKPTSSLTSKLIWFSSVARNAFVVIGCAVTAYLLDMHHMTPFSLTPEVPEGLPSFVVPVTGTHNGTSTLTLLEKIREIGTGVFVIPFVAILSNVAIAKSFAQGKVIDSSQEMIAVGLCNVVGSFFGSYPVNASFTRAAVSNASGVRTPLSGLYTGGIVILALTFLTPCFSYIPKPTLAAVIICAVIFMVDLTTLRMIWLSSKIDLVPFFVTFLCCLLMGIEIGILSGVCVDIIFVLYGIARPKTTVDKVLDEPDLNYMSVIPTSAILFPSVEFVREKVMKKKETHENDYKFIVFDCQRINKLDFTAARSLSTLVGDIEKMGKEIIFYRPNKLVSRVIKKLSKDSVQIIESEDCLKDILRSQNQSIPPEIVGPKDSKVFTVPNLEV